MLRRLKRIGIALLILLLLLVILGVVYTWYMGTLSSKTTPAPIEKSTTRKELTPPQTDPDAAVGVYIQSMSKEVVAGTNSAITLRSQPNADCVIKLTYGTVESKDSGLMPKRTDEYGMVTWSWTVEPTAPLGKSAAEVTCSRNKRSGYVRGDFVVVKELN